MTFFTEQEMAFVSKHRKMLLNDLTDAFNAQFNTSRTKSSINGLRKRKKWSSGRAGHFKKGHAPLNKGKKQAVSDASKRTQFKKGNQPHNHVPVGTIRKTTDGYLKQKLQEPNVWEFLHKLIWTDANGEISEGHILFFKDCNHENCSLDNLECITRSEQARRNKLQYSSYPDELKPTVALVAKLQKKGAEMEEKANA